MLFLSLLSPQGQDSLRSLPTCYSMIQLASDQLPQVLFCQAALQPLFPKPVPLHEVVVTQMQELALGLAEPHTIGLRPMIQPVQIPLSFRIFKQINISTQLGVICKLTEGAFDPLIQVIDKDIKEN
ncbi:integral membrane protein dgcr2 idd [Limosa lapponica baueri]|uniref:Integral membrane protein dgcr2 idd n=1 Tax=Limosa lapponica baueri TaxID=1758121 RepID=A0A2I0TXE5_LIMLA|nr:integral membrane protein dgcr2 idd [Limosa lapponica baueri]